MILPVKALAFALAVAWSSAHAEPASTSKPGATWHDGTYTLLDCIHGWKVGPRAQREFCLRLAGKPLSLLDAPPVKAYAKPKPRKESGRVYYTEVGRLYCLDSGACFWD